MQRGKFRSGIRLRCIECRGRNGKCSRATTILAASSRNSGEYFCCFVAMNSPSFLECTLNGPQSGKEGGTPWTHPLFGELLACSGLRRWNSALLLVVDLPDGSPGTIVKRHGFHAVPF